MYFQQKRKEEEEERQKMAAQRKREGVSPLSQRSMKKCNKFLVVL